MTQKKLKPFRITVDVSMSGEFLITEEDLEYVRWEAHRRNRGPLPMQNPLEDEQLLNDLINEMVESKFDLYDPNLDRWDFDWHGVSWEELFNAIRGLDENGEPLRPPEIPGQITMDDVLSEYV